MAQNAWSLSFHLFLVGFTLLLGLRASVTLLNNYFSLSLILRRIFRSCFLFHFDWFDEFSCQIELLLTEFWQQAFWGEPRVPIASRFLEELLNITSREINHSDDLICKLSQVSFLPILVLNDLCWWCFSLSITTHLSGFFGFFSIWLNFRSIIIFSGVFSCSSWFVDWLRDLGGQQTDVFLGVRLRDKSVI